MYANDTEKFSSSLSIDRRGQNLGDSVPWWPRKSEEMRRGPPSFETRFPNYPDSSEKPAFTGVIWEKAMLQIACPAVIYPGSFHGRKGRKKRRGGEGKKEEERRTRRRREFLALWVLSIHDRRASCLFHGLTRVTKRHSF